MYQYQMVLYYLLPRALQLIGLKYVHIRDQTPHDHVTNRYLYPNRHIKMIPYFLNTKRKRYRSDIFNFEIQSEFISLFTMLQQTCKTLDRIERGKQTRNIGT
jgi:hypothetical protein